METLLLFSRGKEHVALTLESLDRNFEYIPNSFTTRYTLSLEIKASIYTTSFILDFYKINLDTFLQDLKKVYSTLFGSARLNNGLYDNDFMLIIESYGSKGKILFDLNLQQNNTYDSDVSEDRLSFIRIIDQSYLPNIIYLLEQFLTNI